jgi:hypothetical protein
MLRISLSGPPNRRIPPERYTPYFMPEFVAASAIHGAWNFTFVGISGNIGQIIRINISSKYQMEV